MHLRLLPEKGKIKFGGVLKMEMLVTKFSKGKYRNEGELFSELISKDNVKLMGEMIALQALRTVKKYDLKIADKLYIGLIKDLHHINEIDYTVSDTYGKDRIGKEITIKNACYREIDRFIDSLRNRSDRHKQVECIDFTNYKALPMDPVDCFEKEQDDYSKADALLDAMHLTEKERQILEYYMSGWKRSEIAKILCVTKSCMDYRKFRIRYKYRTYIGQF